MRRKLNKQKKINTLTNLALKNLGKPYFYGAKPSKAPRRFDCSGFVQYLYRHIGIKLPRTTIQQAELGRKINSKKIQDLKTGDLLFFHGSRGYYNKKFPQGIGHVIMYLSDNKIIHAKSIEKSGRETGRVMTEPADKWLGRKDLTVIKRII